MMIHLIFTRQCRRSVRYLLNFWNGCRAALPTARSMINCHGILKSATPLTLFLSSFFVLLYSAEEAKSLTRLLSRTRLVNVFYRPPGRECAQTRMIRYLMLVWMLWRLTQFCLSFLTLVSSWRSLPSSHQRGSWEVIWVSFVKNTCRCQNYRRSCCFRRQRVGSFWRLAPSAVRHPSGQWRTYRRAGYSSAATLFSNRCGHVFEPATCITWS